MDEDMGEPIAGEAALGAAALISPLILMGWAILGRFCNRAAMSTCFSVKV